MQADQLLKVKNLLLPNNFDAALFSSLANIVYLTDFHYFSDIEREAFILITKKNNYIFTDARYSHAVKKQTKNFILAEISSTNSFRDLLKEIIKKEKINILGIEENNLTVHEYKQIISLSIQTQHFDLNSIRIIKNQKELNKIKQACTIGDKMFAYILKNIYLGVSEKEIASMIEAFFRKAGCEPSFPTIVAFQENAAIPHHKTGDRKLKKNELILIDSGVKYNEYCSDMTRTIFYGKPTIEQKRVYETVLHAQLQAINYIEKRLKEKKPIHGSDVDKAARDYIINHSFPAYTHGLGHGVGLQVHEPPRLSSLSQDILQNGMVFSIEPGIYLNDDLGVRIEDLFTIENNQLIQLTKSPRNIIEISE